MDLLQTNHNTHIELLNIPRSWVVKNKSDIMFLNLQELGIIKNKSGMVVLKIART
jgi:hypothetical protein